MKLKFSTAALFLLFSFAANAQPITLQLDNYLSTPKKKNHFNGTALVVHKGNILLYKGYGFKNVTTKTRNDTATLIESVRFQNLLPLQSSYSLPNSMPSH